jgi:glucoamylase
MDPLERWIDRQYRYATTAMLASISPTGIVKRRPAFAQLIRARRGAIVASVQLAAYDPDPDYFFHWFRDSAVIIDALRLLYEDRTVGEEALGHLHDFVRFSLSLQQLDGRELVATPGWRERVAPEFRRFLREDGDLAATHGEAVAADVRVNADGTLDISRWGRPQYDGPALRALALLRWSAAAPLKGDLESALANLVRADLLFIHRHWREPCFDIWEEEQGLHYYTLCVAAAALEAGATWLGSRGEQELAQRLQADPPAIRRILEDYWLPAEGHYRSRVLSDGTRSSKELDIAVILAAIHVADTDRRAVNDPHMYRTLARLSALFDAAYPINRNRPAERGPAMGRYAGDVYYSGGAYYFSSLGAAEFCFQAARDHAVAPAAELVARGDAYLETVRTFTPPSGEMSEQFDQRSGGQTSAKQLAWSHAALISCVAARRHLTESRP